jgi:hypothetical protein
MCKKFAQSVRWLKLRYVCRESRKVVRSFSTSISAKIPARGGFFVHSTRPTFSPRALIYSCQDYTSDKLHIVRCRFTYSPPPPREIHVLRRNFFDRHTSQSLRNIRVCARGGGARHAELRDLRARLWLIE